MHPFGAGSRKRCQTKTHFDPKGPSHLGALFRVVCDFLTLDFSFISEVTSDSELCALWSSLFGGISRLVAKVRMKLPRGRQHRFRGFRLPKQRQISWKGSEGARGWRFLTLLSILGARRGSKGSRLKLANAFFGVRDFNDFLHEGRCDLVRGRRQRVCPRNLSIC